MDAAVAGAKTPKEEGKNHSILGESSASNNVGSFFYCSYHFIFQLEQNSEPGWFGTIEQRLFFKMYIREEEK